MFLHAKALIINEGFMYIWKTRLNILISILIIFRLLATDVKQNLWQVMNDGNYPSFPEILDSF